jgi:hypothetical protein
MCEGNTRCVIKKLTGFSFLRKLFILFFVRKEKYAKETLSCERIEKFTTHLMDTPKRRFTSSFWEYLYFIVSREFLAILIARSHLIQS